MKKFCLIGAAAVAATALYSPAMAQNLGLGGHASAGLGGGSSLGAPAYGSATSSTHANVGVGGAGNALQQDHDSSVSSTANARTYGGINEDDDSGLNTNSAVSAKANAGSDSSVNDSAAVDADADADANVGVDEKPNTGTAHHQAHHSGKAVLNQTGTADVQTRTQLNAQGAVAVPNPDAAVNTTVQSSTQLHLNQ